MAFNEIKITTYLIAPVISAYLTSYGINDSLLYGLFAMMGLDILSALIMWLRIDPGKITSRVFKRGMSEKLASMIPAGVIFIMLLALDSKTIILLNGYLTLLILAEGYSAISNAQCAYTKIYKEEYDAVSAVLKWAKSQIIGAMRKITGDKPSSDNENTL